jgi:tripartite-type tricarboxylate transporter receptor subunit TctC
VAVTAIPQVQSGALKPLAVTSRQRLASLPDVPTAIEAGLPDFVGNTWNSIAAPAGTPQPIIDRINRDVQAVLAQPAIRDRLAALGSEFLPPMTPAEVDAFYAREREQWIPIVREASKPRS